MSSLFFWFVYFELDDVYKVKALFVVLDRTTEQCIYTLDFRFLKLLYYNTCSYLKRTLYLQLTKEMHTEKSCFGKKVQFWYQTNVCPTAHNFDIIWASQLRFRVVIKTIGTLGFDHRISLFFKKGFVLLPKCVMQIYKSISLFLCLLVKFQFSNHNNSYLRKHSYEKNESNNSQTHVR